MKNLVKSKAFIVGMFVGILLLIAANIYSALPDRKDGVCFDCYLTYGFPFALHESGTMLHLDQFILVGLAANLFVAVICSFAIGLIFEFIFSKIVSHYSPLK